MRAAGLSSWFVARKFHRWLGLVVGIQFLFWVVSGLYFAVVPSAQIAGKHNKQSIDPPNYAFTPLLSPQLVLNELAERTGPSLQVRELSLARVQDRNVYRISYDLAGESRQILADAETGELLKPLDEALATSLARGSFIPDSEVVAVRYLESLSPGHEYRWGTLPVWQVSFNDPENTRVYVHAVTGEVVTHRNDSWRLFDLFWMLHIMDFSARTDFHNRLLQAVSLLALLIIITGYYLWWKTRR